MILVPGSKLGPYEILSSIGSGGMGEVWKARDTRLGRIVAIKKVKEQHSERFKQEARYIAALNHPNICQIHDIGDDYLVLEYVEGKPLSSPLPEKEAVKLAIQIVTALEAAHKKGIIHRDLKPANIMVTDEGSVKLLDFGLAKLYEQDMCISILPTKEFPVTQAGAILGTIAYLSPEQAQGGESNTRSDIFSFGLVLYEMLSGRKAFSGDSSYAVMDAIVKKEPPPLQTSLQLERIVKRCLEKNPEERYQTMSELKAALEKAIEKKVVIDSEKPQPSIAVLPFVNMSGDKEQEYFSDGLAEEIINALTKIPGLKVIARTSAFAFKGENQDITRIAKALRVSSILEGSVRRSGNRLRITAELITASDGSHLWSERYDREMTDVFEIQDEICLAIVDRLRKHLITGYSPITHKIKDLEAYNLYLKGRHYFHRNTPEDLAKAKDCYSKAVETNPDYALAWYGLAYLSYNMGYLGYIPPQKGIEEANQAISKALKLDDTLAEAHALEGMLLTNAFDWKGAKRAFHRALELDPNSVDTYMHYASHYLVPQGRLYESLATIRKAAELDPLAPILQFNLGNYYFGTRQWGSAVEYYTRALDFDPNFYLAYQYLGFTYLQMGRLDEGIVACEKAAKMIGKGHWALAIPGVAYAQAGKIDEAKKLLKELLAFANKAYVPPTAISWVYCSLGEVEKALEWFEKAIDQKDVLILITHAFPICDPLRSHPRYKALLRKMNLEP